MAHSLWPIILIQDRYNGAYSHGAWLAVACADAPHELDTITKTFDAQTRIEFLMDGEGPMGSDGEALAFWDGSPKWIAAADTPDAALAKLLKQVSS